MRKASLLLLLLGTVNVPEAAVAGAVTGSVAIQSSQKHRPPTRYYMGPRRSGRGPDVYEEGGPSDVVVYLEGVKGAFPPPATHPQMVQKDETFVPHVLPVLVGSTVEFPNEDDFYHNVFSVVAGDRFDLGRYAHGKSTRQTLTKPGAVIVRCEIHSNMKAFILVLSNPFFAVPDVQGHFDIGEVPAGSYSVKAWHPTLGEQTRAVTVPASGAVSVSFDF